MKTAEEWIKQINEGSHQIWPSGLHADNCTGCIRNRNNLELIKQIQLDALKEGMRRGAEVANKSCYKGGYQFAREHILAAGQELTEKDLRATNNFKI